MKVAAAQAIILAEIVRGFLCSQVPSSQYTSYMDFYVVDVIKLEHTANCHIYVCLLSKNSEARNMHYENRK